MAVKGRISIKDNASSVLKNVRSETKKLSSETKKTGSVMKSVWNKTYKLKADVNDAKKKIKSVTSEVKKLKPVTAVLKAKDIATKTVKKVKSGLDAIGKRTVAPVIRVVDKASSKIKGIAGSLGKVAKAVAIPLTVAGAIGTAAVGGAVSAGMQLEQQQISIEHFVGATNKDMSASEVKSTSQGYIQSLRENANATPFETGEVIQAGTRAISVAGGSTTEAMGLVTLAEDMAAASGGTKTIMDAMEALADAKVGETERLKEFGFKVSAEDFKEKGFSGVTADLQDFYGGASGKLAGSGAGLMSTITGKLKSNASDFGLGVVEQIKPVLSDIIGLIDAAQPHIQQFSSIFGQGIGNAIKTVGGAFTQIQPLISSLTPIFTQIQTVATSLLPVFMQVGTVISAVATGIATAVSAIAPVVVPIFSEIGEKVGSVISFLAERSGFIQEVMGTAGSAIASVISTAWSVIGPIMDFAISIFKTIFSVVQTVWPGISSIISGVWSILKPIFEGLGKGVELLAGAFNKVAGFVGGIFGGGSSGGGTPGKNAKGTNSWRGGVTWVGENGPELVDLPKGTRILPTKESLRFAAIGGNVISFPQNTGSSGEGSGRGGHSVVINKIADNIEVRSDKDIDDIAELTAKKILEEFDNVS